MFSITAVLLRDGFFEVSDQICDVSEAYVSILVVRRGWYAVAWWLSWRVYSIQSLVASETEVRHIRVKPFLDQVPGRSHYRTAKKKTGRQGAPRVASEL
jgi:hypothetical protein